MPIDLDTRIHALVGDVLNTAPLPPDLSTREPARARRRSPSWRAAAVTFVAIAAVIGIATGLRLIDPSPSSSPPSSVAASLGFVPQGVSWWEAKATGRAGVFLVRDGDNVTAFKNDAQHLGGEHVWWCPDAQVFYAPTHGETFDRFGRKLSGPGRRGLDQYRVRRVGQRRNKIEIDFDHVTKGPPIGTAGEGQQAACANWSVGIPHELPAVLRPPPRRH